MMIPSGGSFFCQWMIPSGTSIKDDQDDGQLSERANYAKHHLFTIGPVHFAIPR
jgi:hypothetical protein